MAEWTEEANWEDSYAGRFSFMRMPLAETADGADIAVLGIPLDMTTTGRPGARFGPLHSTGFGKISAGRIRPA